MPTRALASTTGKGRGLAALATSPDVELAQPRLLEDARARGPRGQAAIDKARHLRHVPMCFLRTSGGYSRGPLSRVGARAETSCSSTQRRVPSAHTHRSRVTHRPGISCLGVCSGTERDPESDPGGRWFKCRATDVSAVQPSNLQRTTRCTPPVAPNVHKHKRPRFPVQRFCPAEAPLPMASARI